jgi:hypothetical protein
MLSGQFLELNYAIRDYVQGKLPTPPIKPSQEVPSLVIPDMAYIRFIGVSGIGTVGNHVVPTSTADTLGCMVGVLEVQHDPRLVVEADVVHHPTLGIDIPCYSFHPADGYEYDWPWSNYMLFEAIMDDVQLTYTGTSTSDRSMNVFVCSVHTNSSPTNTKYFSLACYYAGAAQLQHNIPKYKLSEMTSSMVGFGRIALQCALSQTYDAGKVTLDDLDLYVYFPIRAA